MLYEISREYLKINSRGALNYFFNGWDWVSFLKIIMISLCGAYMTYSSLVNYRNESAMSANDHIGIRFSLVITSCLIYLSLISFLRNAFLSVATFVSGTVQVGVFQKDVMKFQSQRSINPSSIHRFYAT